MSTSDYTPTPEMTEFAKECVRVNSLNRAGLSTQEDISRLEQMGERARSTQKAANMESDRRRGRWA